MKRWLILMLTFAASVAMAQEVVEDWAREDVRTVQLYRPDAEQEFPVLSMQGRGVLKLEFDLMQSEAETYIWRIVHLDHQWRTDQLAAGIFMIGFAEGTVDDYDFSFTTRVDYVHYELTLPSPMARFNYSGNYAVQVLNEADSALVVSRRFCVSEQAVGVQMECLPPYDGIERDRRQEVDVRIGTEKVSLNPMYLTVMMQQNRRIDNVRELTFSGYERNALRYAQRPTNCFWAGNNFRYFDCSHLGPAIYHMASVTDEGGIVVARLQPEEVRSHKPFSTEKGLLGGMKVNVWDRQRPKIEADYVWVEFTLPMRRPMLVGEVYIVGELTGWRMDSTSRMDFDFQRRAYTKRLQLKQGYYSYQLLSPEVGHEADRSATAMFEGDHRETPNTYTVFVYQHAPSDQADRLLAVGRMQCGSM